MCYTRKSQYLLQRRDFNLNPQSQPPWKFPYYNLKEYAFATFRGWLWKHTINKTNSTLKYVFQNFHIKHYFSFTFGKFSHIDCFTGKPHRNSFLPCPRSAPAPTPSIESPGVVPQGSKCCKQKLQQFFFWESMALKIILMWSLVSS